MSGQLIMHRPNTELEGSSDDVQVLTRRSDHAKYVVQIVSTQWGSGLLVATAGWDQKVQLYYLSDYQAQLEDPVHTINLPTNPQSLVLVRPNPDDLCLVISRTDSTHLYYYQIRSPSNPNFTPFLVEQAGRQNLAPHSNAWVSFTPSCLAICPTDPTLLAVATSHLPHMKLIVVRLLFPASDSSRVMSPHNTQASQERAALALQDREDTAIVLHVSTLAPQTPYSTPQVVWRPDGSGVWVNGDDGVIRGIEIQTGKVVSTLQGHEQGTKVRTLWAGNVKRHSQRSHLATEDVQEVLVSGGFDKQVIVWRIGA